MIRRMRLLPLQVSGCIPGCPMPVCAPELDCFQVIGGTACVEIERVCTVAAHYCEHGHKPDCVQPYHMFFALRLGHLLCGGKFFHRMTF